MNIRVDIGSIFCIPLFMDKNDWKLKTKLREEDLDKEFAFGRVIDTSSSVLVEIFKEIGPATTDLSEIVSSGVMFSPVKIFWDGVIKKRWRVIGQTENYDKFKDSDFSNLKMVFGLDDDMRLRDLATEKETPISRDEIKHYEYATVWSPIDLENRIIQHLRSTASMSLDLLIQYLGSLSSELSKSGKKDTAMFFTERCNILENSGIDSCDAKDALTELTTCRAIAQYGNFSFKEEEILDRVVAEAIRLCASE